MRPKVDTMKHKAKRYIERVNGMAGGALVACAFLASGHSKRFGSDKLCFTFRGMPLAEYVLRRHPAEIFINTVVVTRSPSVALAAAMRGFTVAENEDETDDIAKTIRLGLSVLPKNVDGCMFSVCDAPYFTQESTKLLVNTFAEDTTRIVAASANGVRQNPVIFPQSLFAELAALPQNQGGAFVIKKYPALLRLVEVPPDELRDIDRPCDIV